MAWTVQYKNTKQVEKAVFKMTPSTRRAFGQAVLDLMNEGPWPKGWKVRELHGSYKGALSLNLDIRHRMTYSVFSGILTIEIIEVSTRENAYQ